MTKEDLFWNWFVANEERFRTSIRQAPQAVQALYIEFYNELQRYCPGLFFQLGGVPHKERRELFLTARGNKALFPAVEALVAAAPRMEHWMPFAHMQPVGTHFWVFVDEVTLGAKQTWFLPLEDSSRTEPLRIRVCVPHYRPDRQKAFRGAVQDLLYGLLGEKAAVCDLDECEVDDLANYDVEKDGLRRLTELETFIRTRKQRIKTR